MIRIWVFYHNPSKGTFQKKHIKLVSIQILSSLRCTTTSVVAASEGSGFNEGRIETRIRWYEHDLESNRMDNQSFF